MWRRGGYEISVRGEGGGLWNVVAISEMAGHLSGGGLDGYWAFVRYVMHCRVGVSWWCVMFNHAALKLEQ